MIPQRKIEAEKARLTANCEKCGGASCSICQRYCSFVDQMAEAGVPVDYWFRRLDQWYGDPDFADWLRSSYLSDLGRTYGEGKVLCLCGHRGVGKTMAACCVLKEAIKKGYSAHYTSLNDAVDAMVSDESYKYKHMLRATDFLVVDEVDQRFFGTVNKGILYGTQFEAILRMRTQNRLPMVICTNASELDKIFTGEFETSFESLRSQFFIECVVMGKDVRRSKGEKA
jgi:DNA replication protein DnaC